MRQGAINQLPRLLRARQDKVYLPFFTPTVCVGPMGLATVSIGPPSAFPRHMHIERKRRKYRVCEAEIRTEQVVCFCHRIWHQSLGDTSPGTGRLQYLVKVSHREQGLFSF